MALALKYCQDAPEKRSAEWPLHRTSIGTDRSEEGSVHFRQAALAVALLCVAGISEGATTVVNVTDCGGTNDAAIQLAFDVAQGLVAGTGSCGIASITQYIGAVHFPVGTYTLSTTVDITRSLHVSGVRGGFTDGSIVVLDTGTTNGFHIQTDEPVVMTDLTIASRSHSNGQTAGYAILVEGASSTTSNTRTTIERVTIRHPWIGVQLKAAVQLSIRDCFIQEAHSVGVQVANDDNADLGDNHIEGTTIAGSVSGSIGVLHLSGGGLRILNSKIQGHDVGYRLLLTPNAQGSTIRTSILQITGSSLEDSTYRNIQLFRGSAVSSTSLFNLVTITGNQFAFYNQEATAVNIEVADLATVKSASWLNGLTITGNVFQGNTGAASIAIHQAKSVHIASNVFMNWSTGIYLNTAGTVPQDVNIGGNTYSSVTTHISGSGVATLCCTNCN
jgi:hypothetical protein